MRPQPRINDGMMNTEPKNILLLDVFSHRNQQEVHYFWVALQLYSVHQYPLFIGCFFLKIYQAVAMPLIAKRGLRSSCCPAGEMLSSCPCRSCCFFCWVKIDDGSKPINKKHTFGGDEHPPTRRYQSLGRYLITSHFSSPPILVMFSWSSSGWKVVSEHNLRKLCDQARGAVGYWWVCCQPVARQNLGLIVT